MLFLCAIYNAIYMFEDFIKCSPTGQLIKVISYTAGILYLFFNFEQMLRQMENDNQAIRGDARQRASSSNLLQPQQQETSLVNESFQNNNESLLLVE